MTNLSGSKERGNKCINDTFLLKGDFVEYKKGDHIELGVVKSVTDRGAYVWYNIGGTAVMTPFRLINKINEKEINPDIYINKHVINILKERRKRVLEGPGGFFSPYWYRWYE